MPESPQINWAPSTLPSTRHWQNNQFFCLITQLSKAGSYQDNACAPSTNQALSSYPCSNPRAANNSYVLNCTESRCSGVSDWSRCLMFANRARFFSERDNLYKTLETFENLFPFSTSLETKIKQSVIKVTSYDEILHIQFMVSIFMLFGGVCVCEKV